MIDVIKQVLGLSGKYKKSIQIAFVIECMDTILIQMPLYLLYYAVYKIMHGQMNKSVVMTVSIILLATVIVRIILRQMINVLQSSSGYKIFAEKRIEFGDYVKKLPMGFFSEENISEFISVVSTDINLVEENAMSKTSKGVAYLSALFVNVVFFFYLDYRVGLAVLATYIVSLMILSRTERITTDGAIELREVEASIGSRVVEFIKGISIIKAFNLIGDKTKSLNYAIHNSRKVNVDFVILVGKKMVFNVLNTGIALFVIVFLGAKIGGARPEIGILILLLTSILYLPITSLTSVMLLMRVANGALERFKNAMSHEIIKETEKDTKIEKFDISFKDVSFAYNEKEVLKDVSFSIKENSMLALVGESGSGKTTIANLIVRFWDIQSGSISVGGENIKDVKLDELLSHISVVFQQVYLFNDTILNNIKMGKSDASMEEVIEACKKARCYDFIMGKEQGFETLVGEGGFSLSEGEKQRISIARAILKDAPIIILDEATSSVDPDNEYFIQEAINELIKDKTLIVIAHKLSTIKEADKILVLQEGQVIQEGTHAGLIENEGYYQNMWTRRQKAVSWTL